MQWITTLSNIISDSFSFIPIWQIVLLIGLCVVCFVFRQIKLALLITYFFVFMGGFVSNGQYFMNLMGSDGHFSMIVYVFACLLLALMGLYSLFQETH